MALLNKAPANNALISQAEKKVESEVPADMKDAYSRIVVAGMTLAMNGGPKSLLASLKQSKNPMNDVVKGAIGILGIARKQSSGQMPVRAMIPAGMTLVLHGLDFAEKVGVMKVGKEEIAQAAQLYADTILPLMGATKQKLAALGKNVHGAMQDPAKMQMIKAQLMKQGQPAGGGNGLA